MRIVFAGTPEVAVPSLEALLDNPRHSVIAVITRPDARRGRGRTLHRSPVAALADAHAIPVLTPTSARDPDFAATLTELAPEAAAVVAYGNLLPQHILDIPTHGWINLHFSLLPAWRGAAPVNAAIAAGDDITGASTFQLEAAMDTGPVFATITEPINPTDTAGALLDRLSRSGATLLSATLDGIAAGHLRAVPQSPEGVSYASKMSTESARIRWELPAHVIDRHIRSCTPTPGAWSQLGEARLKVHSAFVVTSTDADLADRSLQPGHLWWTKRAVYVGTGTDPLRLDQVQPPGKKSMNARDWVRGAQFDGEVVLR